MGAAFFFDAGAMLGFADAIADAVRVDGEKFVIGLSGLKNWIGFEVGYQVGMQGSGAILAIFAVDGEVTRFEVEITFASALGEFGAADAGPFDNMAGELDLSGGKVLEKLGQFGRHEEIGQGSVGFVFSDLNIVQEQAVLFGQLERVREMVQVFIDALFGFAVIELIALELLDVVGFDVEQRGVGTDGAGEGSDRPGVAAEGGIGDCAGALGVIPGFELAQGDFFGEDRIFDRAGLGFVE